MNICEVFFDFLRTWKFNSWLPTYIILLRWTFRVLQTMADQKIIVNSISCPICNKDFEKELIENHVNKCLFLNTPEQGSSKRNHSHLRKSQSPFEKRIKLESSPTSNLKQAKVIFIIKYKI